MISTRDLSALPAVDVLRRNMQAMAVLDAVLCSEWDSRYFSYDSRWATGEEMGSMRNGSGEEFIAFFNAAGCWLKGFDHESPISPMASNPPKPVPGIFDGVPAPFLACLTEPAFSIQASTFCIWRLQADTSWSRGTVRPALLVQDGSESLLQYLDGRPGTYQAWAEEYYEVDVPIKAVRSVFAHVPMDKATVRKLNDEIELDDIREDLEQIGYPMK